MVWRYENVRMTSSREIAPAMGSDRLKNATPAVASTSRISSVAYATDESASDANTASPTALPMAWWGISAVSSARPNSRLRIERDLRSSDSMRMRLTKVLISFRRHAGWPSPAGAETPAIRAYQTACVENRWSRSVYADRAPAPHTSARRSVHSGHLHPVIALLRAPRRRA